MEKLSEIYYLLNNVDPKNKLSVFWFNIKKKIERLLPYGVKDFYHKRVKTIWLPQHSRIRKVVPRFWVDLDWVIEQVNFEIIKSFYEDEYTEGLVDWNSDKEHRKFSKWLTETYMYITKDRPNLQKEMEASYPESRGILPNKMDRLSYEKLYGKVDKIEKQIKDTDTKILTELIKYREFLWT